MSGKTAKRERRQAGISTNAKRDAAWFDREVARVKLELNEAVDRVLEQRIDRQRKALAIIGVVLWLAALALLAVGVR